MGTFLGVFSGVCLILLAILRGGDPGVFFNLNSVLIVLGGTAATSYIAFPANKIKNLFPVIINSFKAELHKSTEYIDDLVDLAAKYRTGGIKTLESEEHILDHKFLKGGIAMIVDGYSSMEIHEILDRELQAMMERHNAGQKILRFMAVQAPIFGLAGTLIGLIQMLMHIENPATIGPSLATALITTFYGLILANLVITPIVAKLNTQTENEAVLNKVIRVGILGIQDRQNPQKIRRSINALLPPNQRQQ